MPPYNLVILSTTLDISAAVNRLLAEGHPVHAEDLATIAPYQKDNVQRFGDYILDMGAATAELDGHLELDVGQLAATPPGPPRPSSSTNGALVRGPKRSG